MSRQRYLRLGLIAAPIAALASAHPALAQDAVDRVSIDLGATAVSQYISRGVSYSAAESVQPFVTATLSLPDVATGAVQGVYLSAGLWNSVQSGSPGSGQQNRGDLKGWYEADAFIGAGARVAGKVDVFASVWRYTSPADSFGEYTEFQVSLRYDDSSAWGGVPLRDFALSPALLIAREKDRPGRRDAVYVEPSVAPSFAVGDAGWRVAVPVAVGLSDYYYDARAGGHKTFGYVRTGIALTGRPAPRTAPGLTLDTGIDVWLPNTDVASGLGETETVFRAGVVSRF